MITRENIGEIIDSIDKKDFNNVMDSEWDEVVLILNIFNDGYVVQFETSENYDAEEREGIINDGGLVCYKDELIDLIKTI